MEPTVKEILESDQYLEQRAIINREINWGSLAYAANQGVFQKTKVEKERVKELKRAWLTKMRAQFPDFTRKNGGKKKFRQTLTYGENI